MNATVSSGQAQDQIPDGPAAVLDALDPEQREVALAARGPVCVLAGAGTGKTRAITHRIAYAALTGVADPARVLALTFTVRAAGELVNGVKRISPRRVAVGELVGVGDGRECLAQRLARQDGMQRHMLGSQLSCVRQLAKRVTKGEKGFFGQQTGRAGSNGVHFASPKSLKGWFALRRTTDFGGAWDWYATYNMVNLR